MRLWAIPLLCLTTFATFTFDQYQGSQHILGSSSDTNSESLPNIVIILADDQDEVSRSVDYMPRLKEHIINSGTRFANHFTTTAICCPSRVSLWTGRQPHNTNVTDVDPPYGGFPKFISQGLNDAYLPVWLQDEGYNTYYTGKMFNSHTIWNYATPHLRGWTGSRFLLDPGTYSYMNPIYQKDQDPPVHYYNQHTTELIQEFAADLLNDALKSGKPFFAAIAPVAPHSNIDANHAGVPRMTEPLPLSRHQHLFQNERIPRTSNFNPDEPSGVDWIATLPKLNDTAVDYLDHFYRQRLRALQGVDELVEQVVLKLEDAGVLNNTFIIYSSDNGFHLGQHRLPPGKECGFDEDIRVPFYVRGPGVERNFTNKAVTSHIDIAPTLFQLAGIALRPEFDGTPIPFRSNQSREQEPKRHEHVGVEYWGSALAEGDVGGFDGQGTSSVPNNTYKAIRIIGESYSLYYAVWCSNEHELYDLNRDPGQMYNLYHTISNASAQEYYVCGADLQSLLHRLDALLMVMKSCRGYSCVEPWSILHPDGDVRDLEAALSTRFDAFYIEQSKVSFDRCEPGYIVEAEGPQEVSQYRGALSWSHWT